MTFSLSFKQLGAWLLPFTEIGQTDGVKELKAGWKWGQRKAESVQEYLANLTLSEVLGQMHLN